MPVYGADGKLLSHRQLEQQLRKVVERSSYVGPPLGVMTADGRTKWGKVYQRMCKGSKRRFWQRLLLEKSKSVQSEALRSSFVFPRWSSFVFLFSPLKIRPT